MKTLVQFFIQLAGVVSGLSDGAFTSVSDIVSILVAGGSVSPVFAGGISRTDISAELLAVARRWHGLIDEQFGNIDNLVVIIQVLMRFLHSSL
ncbi:MAG: hypothetical protein LBS79_11735 [Tannerella sp.]|jgi:hypothetical protein|nr:hypothetical protein [Tannerella sp.]